MSVEIYRRMVIDATSLSLLQSPTSFLPRSAGRSEAATFADPNFNSQSAEPGLVSAARKRQCAVQSDPLSLAPVTINLQLNADLCRSNRGQPTDCLRYKIPDRPSLELAC
jgi:hypothetical protein